MPLPVGVLRPTALLIALIGVLALVGVALRSEAMAQTNDVTVEITRVAAADRIVEEEVILGATSRPNDLIISGATRVRIRFSETVSGFTLASLTASNATFSNLQVETANRQWTFDATPAADGALSISIAAGAVNAAADAMRGNASAQLSMTAALAAPKVVWADFTSLNANTYKYFNQPYNAGDTIDLKVIFSENVTVSGVPTVGLRTPSKTPGATAYDAPYHSGSGTAVLVFRYTVPAGQNWNPSPTSINSSAISLPSSASITDAAGNAATLTLPPRVIKGERYLATPVPGARAPSGQVGDTHDWALTFSEPVTVTQEPGAEAPWIEIIVNLQTGVQGTARARYLEGSGTNKLTFRYTVLAADNVRTDTTFGIEGYQVRIPNGAGIRNAAGIDVHARIASVVPVNNRSEGTQFTIAFAITAQPSEDVTVHLTSSDPTRLTLEPSAVTFLSGSTDPNHWGIRQTITITLHPDSDAEDNVVMIFHNWESDDPIFNGVSGTLVTFTIVDTYVGPVDNVMASRPVDIQLELGLVEDSDGIVPPGGEGTVEVKLTYSGDYFPLQISGDSWLRIAGDIEWEDRDGRRIGIEQQLPHNLGSAPPCKSTTIDGLTTWSCDLTTDTSRFVIPLGTPDGPFTISGSVVIDGREYLGQLEVTVGTVDELASVELDFATDIAPGDSTDTPTNNNTADDRPYPDAIAVGETTTLQLAVLNEHGKASHAGEISSLVFIASRGTLSLANPVGDCIGGGGSTCQVPLDLLTADNTDQVRVTLTHPGLEQLGAAVVSATVVSTDSEAFNSNSLTVILLGPAESIAIGEPATAVLNYDPPDEDARDLLKLSVAAADASGRTVPLVEPFGRVVVKDPDGQIVWSGSDYAVQNGMRIDWPLRERDDDGALVDGDSGKSGVQPKYIRDADGNLQVQIDIEVDEAAQLTKGEYTIELRAIEKTAEQTFSVGGAAAQVALGEPAGSTAEGGRLTLTATVTDADGNLVGDGTSVVWEEGGTTSQAVLVQLSFEARTSGGSASATYLVVGRGTAWVRASSGDATNTRAMFNLGAPPPAAPTNPAESLSSRRPGAFAAWLGVGATSASALLAGLDGIDSISVWRNGAWLRYEVVDGAATGGGVDFEVRRGEVLRLGG